MMGMQASHVEGRRRPRASHVKAAASQDLGSRVVSVQAGRDFLPRLILSATSQDRHSSRVDGYGCLDRKCTPENVMCDGAHHGYVWMRQDSQGFWAQSIATEADTLPIRWVVVTKED